MADNPLVSNGPTQDNTVLKPRGVDKGGVVTQVVTLDLGGAGAESLVAGSIPVTGSVSVTPSSVPVNPAITGNQYILPVQYCYIGFDAAEGGTTTTVINATAHIARVGDLIKFTTPTTIAEVWAIVSATTVNSITLQNAITGLASGANFFIYRPKPLTAKIGSESLAVAGEVYVYGSNGQPLQCSDTGIGTDCLAVYNADPTGGYAPVPYAQTPNSTLILSGILTGGADANVSAKYQRDRVFDVDSGAGSEWVKGVSLRKAASGGSVEYGTTSDPFNVTVTNAFATEAGQETTNSLLDTINNSAFGLYSYTVAIYNLLAERLPDIQRTLRQIINGILYPAWLDRSLNRIRETSIIESGTITTVSTVTGVTTVSTVTNVAQLATYQAQLPVFDMSRASWAVNVRSRYT